MGDIIINFVKVKPSFYIDRKISENETQKLNFNCKNSWIGTETKESLYLFGEDSNGNKIEVIIPVSVKDLKDALNECLGDNG